MRKMSKVLATALVASSILGCSLPALADDTSPVVPASGQVQAQTPSTSTSPADRAAARKQKLQNQILNLQNAQQFQQDLAPIRQLQAQDKQMRDQVSALRKTVQEKIKADRQAKNYTALEAALTDMIPMQDDIASAGQAALTAKADWVQLKTDNQAKNTQAVSADLTKIQADIQNRITIYQKILADLQKVSGDLGLANANPTPTPAPAVSAPTT